jgi:tRNA-2-methylthio-N6-dimethylallyladenosine synthase
MKCVQFGGGPIRIEQSLVEWYRELVQNKDLCDLTVIHNSPMPRHFFIQTLGCQMNMLDSELLAAELLRAGHRQVDAIARADLILLNTCSVRQHAEDKIYSLLGRLKEAKEKKPQLIVGVLGCMAQKDRHEILRRAPHVDLVVGPGQLGQLPTLIERVASGAGQQVEISLDRIGIDRLTVERSFAQFSPPRTVVPRPTPHQAMVRITFGCDKFCTYCVVPRVRGPEQSRPAAEIVNEVRQLADNGCLEVTLLGQAVNSYRDPTVGQTVELADLLYKLHDVDGLRRLRFVTNHPKHMTEALLQAMRDLPKVSPYLHVPAQSGSNVILDRMKRGYTVEFYRDMLARIREMIPHAAITSDFIVGFCGETDDDFRQTAELVRDARFKNSFIFKYSSRPGTKADELYVDDVPEPVKRRRNNDLLAIQNALSLEDNQPLLGRTVEILVEGPSKVAKKRAHGDRAARGEGREERGEGMLQLVGRTTCDRIVVFDGPLDLVGRILPVTIEKIDAFTLFGCITKSDAR